MTFFRPRKTARRIKARPEQDFHKAVAAFLAIALPDDVFWAHIPNGGARSPLEAKILKEMGVRPGVPDFLFGYRSKAAGMELKPPGTIKPTRKDPRSEAQVKCHDLLHRAGIPVETVDSLEGVEAALRRFGIPLKASTGAILERAAREGGA